MAWQLMPLLETLYNAPNRTSNHIYMVLVIFLMLSQDSTFNASIHKLVKIFLFVSSITYSAWQFELLFILQMLPNVPWYKERLLHQTSLGSLMVIILIRTVKYNLSKLRVRSGSFIWSFSFSICFSFLYCPATHSLL